MGDHMLFSLIMDSARYSPARHQHHDDYYDYEPPSPTTTKHNNNLLGNGMDALLQGIRAYLHHGGGCVGVYI
jgi:hypothetical protein